MLAIFFTELIAAKEDCTSLLCVLTRAEKDSNLKGKGS